MTKKTILALCTLLCINISWAAQYNSEISLTVDGQARKYVLYVPDNVLDPAPLVFSLHGASGHDTDRSPFRTSVADSEGCIVVYPQGADQYFPVFGGYIPGWNSTGFANEDLAFFNSIISDVESKYAIDRNRVYCCGFSNGGMMTYANTSAASDVFAAFASISGFQLNEFHLRTVGSRPVPFLHIHGKADDFVKYSCMPTIRDGMIARNGCNPVPEVTVVNGKYRKSVYNPTEGGFPYVYYEVDGMGHNDYTDRTDDSNSALTMWRFMSQYTLDADCDKTLKWRLNIDTPDFEPKEHNWKVSADNTRFEYGRAKKANNADNNVYPSLQFEAGKYELSLSTDGNADNYAYIQIAKLEGGDVLLSKRCKVGADAKISIDVPEYDEFKLTIVKESADDAFTTFEIHSAETPVDVNSEDADLPEEQAGPETGYLIEIPQDQGKQYDDFSRTAVESCDEYTLYTANADLQIAFKMMDVDVKDCDYVVVKFAEPVAAGWNLAFWEGTSLAGVAEGSTEYVFELEPSMISSGKLPQICMMTFFGGYTAPLIAKVAGVYKHCTLSGIPNVAADTGATLIGYISLSGIESSRPTPGINIVRLSNGATSKILSR